MSSPAVQSIVNDYYSGISPPEELAVNEWADRFRVLPREGAALHGKWKTSNSPYLELPMSLLTENTGVSRVVLKFPSQTGKTEVILNFCGYIMDCVPGPSLVIQPNQNPMGRAFAADRLTPMIRETPSLDSKVIARTNAAGGSTLFDKRFPNGFITVIGAKSVSGLAMRPIQFLACDEIDRWEMGKEGDHLIIARKRLQTYKNLGLSKELNVSSPTFKGIGIDREHEACDTKYEWHMQCPDCGHWQFPSFRNLVFDAKNPENTRYVCPSCGVSHSISVEKKMKRSGKWVLVQEGPHYEVGFWMSQLSSYMASWRGTFKEWLDAQGDPLQEQVVFNTAFCETWDGASDETTTTEMLLARIERFDKQIPNDITTITIGVDLQGDRKEAEVVGWSKDFTSWSLGYHIIPGEFSDKESWEELLKLYKTPFTKKDGTILMPAAMCVDSGNWSQHVYDFVKSAKERWIIPIKGSQKFDADVIAGNNIERNKRAIRRKISGKPPEIIGVSQLKVLVYNLLARGRDQPGYCHFPEDRGEAYFNQLTGERLVHKRLPGKRQTSAWVTLQNAVEALDCRVYALAGMLLLGKSIGRERKRASKGKGYPPISKKSTEPAAPKVVEPKKKARPIHRPRARSSR